MIDFNNIFVCNYSGFLSKCHIVTRYSRIWWKGGGGGVNCNKQGRSSRSRHKVARGWDREGGGCPPAPDGKKKEIRKRLDDSEEGEGGGGTISNS